MNKIFIACPFIKFVKGSNFTDKNFKEFIENLYDLCCQYADNVFLALRREDYGAKPLEHYSSLMDFEEAKNSDLVIAIPDDSMGVAVELGWMSAMKKTIIVVLNEEKEYTPLIKNINKITPGKVILFKEEEKNALSKIEEALKYYNKLIDGDKK